MRLEVERRQPGHIPLGALLLAPLLAMPFAGWLVEQHVADLGTCALKSVVGLPCLTCGATRATLDLLAGDLASAFAFQPLIVSLYAAAAVWGVVSLALFVGDRRARAHLGDTEALAFKVALVVFPLANWVYLYLAGI